MMQFQKNLSNYPLKNNKDNMQSKEHAHTARFPITVTISFSHFLPNTCQNSESKANGKYFYLFITKA